MLRIVPTYVIAYMYEPLIKKEWPRNIELSYVSTYVQTLSHDFINQKNDDLFFYFCCLTPLSAIFQLYHGDQF